MKDLIQRDGERLYTTSLIIADVLERRHDNVLRKIDELKNSIEFNALVFKEGVYKDKNDSEQRLYVLDEESALVLMPFVGGRRSREGQVKLVRAFMAARAELDRLRRMQSSPDWKKLREDTKEAFRFVNLALTHMRKLEGKLTQPHHYMNEAKLMNAVITGEYKGVDRNALSTEQLDLLTRIEMENSKMLLDGKTYKERKQALLDIFIPKLQ